VRHERTAIAAFRSALFGAMLTGLASAAVPDEHPSVDDVMSKLLAKYKQDDKRYGAIADEIDKEVRKALKSAAWLTEQEAGKARPMAEHPLLVAIGELTKAAQAEAAKPDAKAKARRDALVAKFPWNPRLELDFGLDGGSDRPVPTHEKGFIAMGNAPMPVRGFPELHVNEYLWGLDTIVSWRTGVKLGAKLEHTGWDPKKPPTMETALPAWDRIRVYLQGSLPEVPLFAVPWLTHAIHMRLVERRTPPSGEPARMDQMLALLDSKWNGFSFQVPFAKERYVVVQSMHDLVTDHKSFMFSFPQSDHMLEVGDMPFIAFQTISQYAAAFMGKSGASGKDAAVNASFANDSTYLSRYKTLVDLFARSALSPNMRCPEYLAYLDYPKDKMPTERKIDASFDVARRLALVVWAYVGKDPAKLADFLHDNLLAKEGNGFPNNISLPSAFVVMAHEKEPEMLKAIAARIAGERATATNGAAGMPSDFEREFSPYATYLTAQGDPSSDYLIASSYAFHSRATKAIQDAAYAVLAKELK
jgi:hypothetical protein